MNDVLSCGPRALLVSIAVPLVGGERTLLLPQKALRFPVVIFNASNKPQKIWAEDCSVGNGNLTLEITAMNEETFFQPLRVERQTSVWVRNLIRGVTLEPGDTVVREISLYEYQPGERSAGLPFMFSDKIGYVGFPRLGETTTRHLLRMRAVFEIAASDWTRAENIWTGRVFSETRDYTIWGRYL